MPGQEQDQVTHLEELMEDLSARYSRVERAILGDPSVGHIGLVKRMERVEEDHKAVPANHQALDDRRVAGDKRAHDHIEKVEANLAAKVEDARSEALAEIQRVETANAATNARIESKVDKLRWTVMGGAAAIVGAASWLVFVGG